jgi:hypothetical protein
LKDKRVDEERKRVIIKTRIDVTKKRGEFDSLGISNMRRDFNCWQVGLAIQIWMIASSGLEGRQ